MFVATDTAENYKNRHYNFLFWTREYRRQAAYIYFEQKPNELKKYIKNLKKTLDYIHECYLLDSKEYNKFIKAYYLQKNTKQINNIDEYKFDNVTSLEKNFILSLTEPLVSEFLLGEITCILFKAKLSSLAYLNIPNQYNHIKPQSMRMIDLIRDTNSCDEYITIISPTLNDIFSFEPKNFSKKPFEYLINFHKKFGIFPLDLDIPKNKINDGFWGIKYFDELIKNNKMTTDLKKILSQNSSNIFNETAINSLLFEFKSINYLIEKKNFEREKKSQYKYLYLSKECFELEIKNFTQELNSISLFNKKKNHTADIFNQRNRYISYNVITNSFVQIYYSPYMDAKNLKKQLHVIFKFIKGKGEIEKNVMMNTTKIKYREKFLQHKYPYCDDENERNKIKNHINPENKKTIQQYVEIPNENSKATNYIKFNKDEISSIINMNEIFKKRPIFSSQDYQQNMVELIKNFNIGKFSSSKTELVLFKKGEHTIIVSNILDSEADQFVPPSMKIQQTQTDYTPQAHCLVNEACLNLSFQKMEKSQISDAYRAGGILLFRLVESGVPLGKALFNIANMHSDSDTPCPLKNFTDSQFWECRTLAKISITEKRCVSLNEALKNNRSNPSKDKYKYFSKKLLVKK